MKTKLTFAELDAKLDQLYAVPFELHQTQEILDHCTYIEKFIQDSGWSTESYFHALFSENKS